MDISVVSIWTLSYFDRTLAVLDSVPVFWCDKRFRLVSYIKDPDLYESIFQGALTPLNVKIEVKSALWVRGILIATGLVTDPGTCNRPR